MILPQMDPNDFWEIMVFIARRYPSLGLTNYGFVIQWWTEGHGNECQRRLQNFDADVDGDIWLYWFKVADEYMQELVEEKENQLMSDLLALVSAQPPKLEAVMDDEGSIPSEGTHEV